MDRIGVLLGLAAFTVWGLVPIFWKYLQHVPAPEILAHRMVWSLLFVGILLLARRRFQWLKLLYQQPRLTLKLLLASVLVGFNWGLYIYAVNSNQIIESSLGYFINPLVSVALGVLVLKETLRPLQWLAMGFAVVGVLYMTLTYGRVPWIALGLAVSFGIYGLLKKQIPLGAVEGLMTETLLLLVPALSFLLWLGLQGQGQFGHGETSTDVLLILSGALTALPLLLFAMAAKRVPLSVIGLMQYLAPSMQFALGLFLYHEPFDQSRLVGFVFIWSGLVIYTFDALGLPRRFGLVRTPAPEPLPKPMPLPESELKSDKP